MTNTSDDDPILEELRQIRFHLSLLTHEIRSKAIGSFEQDVLKSAARINMFRAFDGAKTTMQIAEIGDVTRQAVLNFVKDMIESGYVHAKTVGSTQLISQNIDGVLDWYYRNHK